MVKAHWSGAHEAYLPLQRYHLSHIAERVGVSVQAVHRALSGNHGSHALHQRLGCLTVEAICGDLDGYDAVVMSKGVWDQLGKPGRIGTAKVVLDPRGRNDRVRLSGDGFKPDRGVRLGPFVDRSHVRPGRRVDPNSARQAKLASKETE